MIKATNETEDILGRPGTVVEIYTHAKQAEIIKDSMIVSAVGVCLLSLFREDMMYLDETCYYFTTR